MESSWVWNAWWADGSIAPWGLVARLLTPILGRHYLGVTPRGLPRDLAILNLDSSQWSKDYLNLRGVEEYGFPYGIPVDQFRFE